MEKKTGKRIGLLGAILGAVVIVGIFVIVSQNMKSKDSEPKIITVSTLEKIINVSELSTFTAVYNGIAEIKNEKNPEKVDYYTSYEARVDAGIDFEKVKIEVDNEEKIIRVSLPEVYITSVNVDIASLDFIFMNDKANGSTVTQEAFKACEADVQDECEQQAAIFELATQNAVNILTALVKPIVEQMDAEYQLIVQ